MASTIVGILNKLKQDVIAKPKKIHHQKVIGINILSKIFELLSTIREPTYQNLKNNEEIYSMAYVAMTMLAVCCRENSDMRDVIGPGLKQIFKLIIVVRLVQFVQIAANERHCFNLLFVIFRIAELCK